MRPRESFGMFCFSLVALALISAFLQPSPSFGDFPSTYLTSSGKPQIVQADFASIQQAINEAENGSAIFVPSGFYYERIIVNKTVSLIGENVSTTIIDGGYGGTIVRITADNVTLTGFTIQNSGWGWHKNGVYVHFADNCQISNNKLLHNCHNVRLNFSHGSWIVGNSIDGDGYGIRFINSSNCTATGNTVSNCIGGIHLQNAKKCTVKKNRFNKNDQGIRLYSPCAHNKIMANSVYDNVYDGMIEAMPGNATFVNNSFFHNNFVNNTYPFICKVSGNVWDSGYPSGGNYWGRYTGTDLGGGPHQNETGSDGIGDTPYVVSSYDVDKYPLMYPWSLLPVHNINTGRGYNGIQEAIDSSETLKRHTLWVESGVYHGNLVVHKSLNLIGENRFTTIIDGDNAGKVLSVNASNVMIVGFTIRNSGWNSPPYGDDCGVLLDHSVGSKMSHCSITNTRIAVYLFYSETNLIENNIVCSNRNGIWLWYSGSNVLSQNSMYNNSYNFGVFGGSSSDFNNTVYASNTVDGKPVRYVQHAENRTFDDHQSIGVLYLINCRNITVQNLNLAGNGHGVFCYNITDSRIENVTAFRNNYGVYLQESSRNAVDDNKCSNNWVGICLQDSDANFVRDNHAGDCEKGISLYEASSNNFTGNTVLSNLFGFRLYSSHHNRFFHNNLIENTHQRDLIASYQNIWDNGCEGNYWSEYNGTDTSLPPDGIGDTHLPWEGVDSHPLMNAYWNPSDVNHDLKVDMSDVSVARKAFGSYPGFPNWNCHTDITGPYNQPDSKIDIRDVALIAKSYGEIYRES